MSELEVRLGDRFLMIRKLGNGQVKEETWRIQSLKPSYGILGAEGKRGIRQRFSMKALKALRSNPRCYQGNADDQAVSSGESGTQADSLRSEGRGSDGN